MPLILKGVVSASTHSEKTIPVPGPSDKEVVQLENRHSLWGVAEGVADRAGYRGDPITS